MSVSPFFIPPTTAALPRRHSWESHRRFPCRCAGVPSPLPVGNEPATPRTKVPENDRPCRTYPGTQDPCPPCSRHSAARFSGPILRLPLESRSCEPCCLCPPRSFDLFRQCSTAIRLRLDASAILLGPQDER